MFRFPTILCNDFCKADVFSQELQVPLYIVLVAFINFLILLLFYSFHVSFNLNYSIVLTHWCFSDDLFVEWICWMIYLLNELLLARKTSRMLFLLFDSSIYVVVRLVPTSKLFAWQWLSCVPRSVVYIFQSIIEKFRSQVNIIFGIGQCKRPLTGHCYKKD